MELPRENVLCFLYYCSLTNLEPRWAIYIDAGFADARWGFFDPEGQATGRHIRIDLTRLRDTERVDVCSGQYRLGPLQPG